MSVTSIDWHLRLDDALIAVIRCESYEFPWKHGKLINSPEFERFRVCFSDEDSWPETQEFDDRCEEIHRCGKFSIMNAETNERFSNLRLNQRDRPGADSAFN